MILQVNQQWGDLRENRGIFRGYIVGLVRNSHSLGKCHHDRTLFSLTGMMVRGIIPIWPNYSGLWISCWCTTSREKRKRLLTDQHDQPWWFQVPYLKAHSQGTFGNSTLLWKIDEHGPCIDELPIIAILSCQMVTASNAVRPWPWS